MNYFKLFYNNNKIYLSYFFIIYFLNIKKFINPKPKYI